MTLDVSTANPVLPDYGAGCVTNVAAAVQHPPESPVDWVPEALIGADRTTVLLTLDGLGWEQLVARSHLAPTLTGVLQGGPVTTVAPSTTSTALTSIATGMPPGEHGIIGYRIDLDGDVLNVLRWSTPAGDARRSHPPEKYRLHDAFGGERPPVVTRAEFATSGFTGAHLDGVRLRGYRTLATLVTEIGQLATAGEPFVYAYWDGLDKVAHEYGLGRHYDNELRWADHLVAEILDVLPPGSVLAVTADHGQVDVGERVIELDRGIIDHLASQSGEGRFRWLHAKPGRSGALCEAAQAHADTGWVVTAEQVVDEGWFGPVVRDDVRGRLGDVALVAREPVAYADVADTGPYHLIGRHGSLTSAEMLVPFIAAAT